MTSLRPLSSAPEGSSSLSDLLAVGTDPPCPLPLFLPSFSPPSPLFNEGSTSYAKDGVGYTSGAKSLVLSLPSLPPSTITLRSDLSLSSFPPSSFSRAQFWTIKYGFYSRSNKVRLFLLLLSFLHLSHQSSFFPLLPQTSPLLLLLLSDPSSHPPTSSPPRPQTSLPLQQSRSTTFLQIQQQQPTNPSPFSSNASSFLLVLVLLCSPSTLNSKHLPLLHRNRRVPFHLRTGRVGFEAEKDGIFGVRGAEVS